MADNGRLVFSLFTREVGISILVGLCCGILVLLIITFSGNLWMDAQVAWAGGNMVNWGMLPYLQGFGLGILVTILAGVLTAMICSEWVKNPSRLAVLGGVTGLVMALAPWNPTRYLFLAIETQYRYFPDIFLQTVLTIMAGMILLTPVAAASAYCYSILVSARLSGWLNRKTN
ncbi:MAG: hypothetical protein WBZ29_03980 [Methanocella sp.]